MGGGGLLGLEVGGWKTNGIRVMEVRIKAT